MLELEWSAFRTEVALFMRPHGRRPKVMLDMRRNPNPQQGKQFPRDERIVMALDFPEAIRLARVVDKLLAGKEAKFDVVHDPAAGTQDAGKDVRTLLVAKGKTGKITIVMTQKNPQRKYSLSLGMDEAFHFNLMLKLMLYEMATGSKAGFRYTWI